MRRIVAQLEALPPDRARLLAGAAYVVSRAANADMAITDDEIALMEQTLVERTGVSEAEAVIVVEIARQQARLFGSTEDYLVTREFKRVSPAPSSASGSCAPASWSRPPTTRSRRPRARS